MEKNSSEANDEAMKMLGQSLIELQSLQKLTFYLHGFVILSETIECIFLGVKILLLKESSFYVKESVNFLY